FRMDNYFDSRMPGANLVYMLWQKALVARTVSLPQNNFGALQTLRGQATHDHVGIPDYALVNWNSHSKRSVASQVLVGQREHALMELTSRAKSTRGIRGRANESTALAAKGFDCGCGVHVSKGSNGLA